MTIEIIPVGGYSEIGRNCTAVKIDDEIVILDMGLHMEKYIEHTHTADRDDIVDMSTKTLMNVGAVPDIRTLTKEERKNVIAICIGHAHLDHIGAVPFLAKKFDCPVYATPFSIEVVKSTIRDDRINIKNELIKKEENSIFRISDNIEIEFINVTHSTPETVMIAIHTKEGVVLYGNDYKIDKTPTYGAKTNIKRLKELKPKAYIVDCLYSDNPDWTPSELVAKQKLKEILLDQDNKGKSIFVTTFSSHIARLKSIKEIGEKMGRKVVFLGRSLSKYLMASENAGLAKFNDSMVVKYGAKVRRYLSSIPNPEQHLFILTGHQGEPKATLSRIVYENHFNFKPEDIVIFSCQIIPVPINFENRKVLEDALKRKHVTVHTDVHVSGHASAEDQREIFRIINPENIIPVHGDLPKMQAMKEIAIQEGYKEEQVHFLKNEQRLRF